MVNSRLIGALCAAVFSLITMSSHAALVDNGGGLIYDDVLDITWAQPDAARDWDAVHAWASGLTQFKLVDFAAHGDLIAMARDDARLLMDRDAGLKGERGDALRHLLYLFERDEGMRLLAGG